MIHALGAGALSLFLVRIGTPRRVAALLALAWALHPIHAESVLSVAGRSAAVGATLVLVSLALLAHDRPRAAGVALALAVLGQRWKLRLDPNQRVETKALITLRPKHGMRMRVEAR